MTAFLSLCAAVERAAAVLNVLEAEAELDRDTQLQVVQIQILLHTAKQTLEAIGG